MSARTASRERTRARQVPLGPTPAATLEHRETRIIRANYAVSKSFEMTPGNIDENWGLPYKPRQLSAMARSDRGGSFGPETVHVWGQHLTDLSHYQANFARSAENDP